MEESNLNHFDQESLFYVGIGASAGGLEALEEFFKNMPANSGLAFIVVQHLSPDYKSLMVELLSKHTKMPVFRAEDSMEVKPDCVYLIPPKKNLTINKGKLYLSDPVYTHGLNLPIDIFLRSLAEDQGEKAIAIILSGTGSDGALGIRAIKGNGGIVFAQDDETAKFDGMPRSAIATGLVDFVLPPSKMPKQLLKIVKNKYFNKTIDDNAAITIGEDYLSKILSIVKENVGVDFSFYKPNTIMRRIERRLSINQFDDIESYFNFLAQSKKEALILYKELLIGVTKFFRDPEAFEIIKNKAIPEIFKEKKQNAEIRVWSVGCSTGEEAYSLAILFKEYISANNIKCELKIFATDIDKDSVEFASAGIYPESIVADVPHEYLNKYFVKKNKGYQVHENIRRIVIFASHNLMKDPHFSKIDLISCRNLLIYIKPNFQKKVFALFQIALNAGGFVFLGSSETLGEYASNFDVISSKWKIYKIKETLKYFDYSNIFAPLRTEDSYYEAPIANNRKYFEDVIETAFDALIGDYIPPSIVVDENYDILHICGDVNQFVKLPSGKASFNLLNLVKGELRTPISIALHKAFKEEKSIIYKNYDFKDDSSEQQFTVDIKIKTAYQKRTKKQIAIVIFDGLKKVEIENKNIEVLEADEQRKRQIQDLEQELKYTKENLQATIEELGAANEELQSTNEELISSNEELQSANEELQSVNEELYTVNAEYQKKIEELTQLNNDMINLLKNTNIGTLFLDSDLKIRKFTPAVIETVNILEMDIGRPIYHISFNFDYPKIIEDINYVLKTLNPREFQVQGRNGKWYSVKILPYRTINNAVEGIVINFIDITERVKYEEELKREKDLLIFILENSPVAKFIIDDEGYINFANKKAHELFNINLHDLLGNNIINVFKEHKALIDDSPDKLKTLLKTSKEEQTYLKRDFSLIDENSNKKFTGKFYLLPIQISQHSKGFLINII